MEYARTTFTAQPFREQSSLVSAEHAYGRASENMLASLMMERFGVLPAPDKYAHFDFESADTIVELKTRRVLSTAYPDYMINGCKLLAAKKSGKKAYFVYKFLDGTFYWEYDPTIVLRTDFNGRRDRGCDETQFMHYLPATLFKPIGTFGPVQTITAKPLVGQSGTESLAPPARPTEDRAI